MTGLHDIVDRLPPGHPPQVDLQLPDRGKPRHTLALLMALCALGLDAHVGRAGIGDVDQVEASDPNPVPPSAVIAPPETQVERVNVHDSSLKHRQPANAPV